MSENILANSVGLDPPNSEEGIWGFDLLLGGLEPEPMLTVSVWADEHRVLPETSAEPGRWRTSRTPYLREIMDVLSPSHPAEFVAFMKGSQVGGTEVGNNWIGYTIHHAPGLMLNVQPTLAMVKRNTTTRVDPLIESTPSLRGRVAAPRSRDGSNSMFRKSFPGGELVMTGANSAAGLRSTPARFLFLDEVDAYPLDADGEGDPVDLAVRRTTTYRGRRKIFMPSTPTLKGQSRIEKAYQESDQRRYFVPCIGCGVHDTITFEKLEFDKDERTAPAKAYNVRYVCQACGHEHAEADKVSHLLPNGEWQATSDGDGRMVGFHLSALYSPFEPWDEICTTFLAVKDDPERFRVWWNTALAEAWEVQGEAPEWERLFERRQSYKIGTVPRGVLAVTCGVDVQGDRLEAEIVGWGADAKTSWSIDYRVFYGDTGDLDDEVWSDLDKLLDEVFPHESGTEMIIERLAIDDGYNSQVVRDWARRHSARRVMVIKGQDRAAAPLWLPSYVDISRKGKKLKRGMRLWPVGVSMLKSQLYGWLKLNPPTEPEQLYPQGYCHIPEYGREYFEQLTAEVIVKRVVKGYTRFEWQKTRERNEALDCRIYARAAALGLGIERWRETDWAERAMIHQTVIEGQTDPSTQSPEPPQTTRKARRRTAVRSSYMR